MQTLLIFITLGSLLMTIVLAIILVRLIRFERRREAARIALLREMADQAAEYDVIDSRVEEPSDIRLREISRDIDFDDVAPAAVSTDLFVRPEPRSAWPRRAAVAAGIAVLVVGGAFALRTTSSRAVGAPPAAAPTTTPTSSQTPGLLELLSLKQTQAEGALTITGLVQNPRDGTELSKVAATALLFAADGSFLASGRAPLDFTVLRPGDESGFVITVPVRAPVARYRIGFRSEDGHVIGHIDRRTASTLATGSTSLASSRRGTS